MDGRWRNREGDVNVDATTTGRADSKSDDHGWIHRRRRGQLTFFADDLPPSGFACHAVTIPEGMAHYKEIWQPGGACVQKADAHRVGRAMDVTPKVVYGLRYRGEAPPASPSDASFVSTSEVEAWKRHGTTTVGRERRDLVTTTEREMARRNPDRPRHNRT